MLKRTALILFIISAGFINTSFAGGNIEPAKNMDNSSLPVDKMKVAIVEFEIQGDLGIQDAGKIMAEWMITAIGKTKKFTMVERVLMKKILEEDKLIMSGVVDEGSAMEIGQKFGVDGLITGAVSKWGSTYTVTVRLIDTKSGVALKFAETKTKDVDDIPNKITAIANEISGSQQSGINEPIKVEQNNSNPKQEKTPKVKPVKNTTMPDKKFYIPLRFQIMGAYNLSMGIQYFPISALSISAMLGLSYYSYPGVDDGVFFTSEAFISYNFINSSTFKLGLGLGADFLFTGWVLVSPALRLEFGTGSFFVNGGIRYAEYDQPIFPFVELGVKF